MKKGITAERECYASAGVKATRFAPETLKSATLFVQTQSAGKLLLRFPHFRLPWRSPALLPSMDGVMPSE
jgi:hypothetical protein